MASSTTAPGLNPNAEEFHLLPGISDTIFSGDLSLSVPFEDPDPINFCSPTTQIPLTPLPSSVLPAIIPVFHVFDQNGVIIETDFHVLNPNGVLVATVTLRPQTSVYFPQPWVECTKTQSCTRKPSQKRASGKKKKCSQQFHPEAVVGAKNQPPRLRWRPKTQNHGDKRSCSVPAPGTLAKLDFNQRRCSSVPAATFPDGSTRKLPNRATGKPKHRLIALTPTGNQTTVMIRNIPNRYSREMLKEFLLDHCKFQNQKDSSSSVVPAAFDFLYLPIDFQSGCNQGYAFVNFTSSEAVRVFHQSRNQQTWDRFSSSKIRDIRLAKVQGKEALIKKFERVEFPEETYQPQVYEPGHDGFSEVEETSIGILPPQATIPRMKKMK